MLLPQYTESIIGLGFGSSVIVIISGMGRSASFQRTAQHFYGC